jgi:hypothetical protein
MTGSRHFAKLVPAIALIALALPASASAQATRTWVSGVGDDANPCSRTAPCKTFAGAISKTAAKGEINCLDPGGFGGVTINKSLAIKCQYTEGGVLVSGTNAIVVNAAATDSVTLRGLDINGIGTGLNAVRILSAKSVKILDSEIFGFVRNGVDMEASNAGARLGVHRTHIHDINGNGVLVAAPAAAGTSGTNGNRATVRDNVIEENGCGIVASSNLPDPAFNFAADCGTGGTNGGKSTINAFNNDISDNRLATGAGIFVNGLNSLVRYGRNDVVNNVFGVRTINGGSLHSWIDNHIEGNDTNGASNGTLQPAKVRARRR